MSARLCVVKESRFDSEGSKKVFYTDAESQVCGAVHRGKCFLEEVTS